MFRPTDPQQSLLESYFILPPAKRVRLEKSWAHIFRLRILPLIDEEMYRDDFHGSTGRPNKSIRMLIGLETLKHWFDLTDRDLVEQLEYNLQFQYALNVTAEEAHIERKTIHNHRIRTLNSQHAKAMFERITLGLIEIDGLQVLRQRLDSTHIISNIAVLTRLGLFVETIASFCRTLRKELPGKMGLISLTLQKRYLDREGYFADVKKEQAQRRITVVVKDLWRLVETFQNDPLVKEMEAFDLLHRLFEEQCQIIVEGDEDSEGGEGGGESGGGEENVEPKIHLRESKTISSQSLQSPHDPDATYGHKGKGYEVQLSESCVETNSYQIITHIEVNGAHQSDQHATSRVLSALKEKGLTPEELLADTAYGSGENIVNSAVNGVDLQAPVQDPKAPPRSDPFLQTAEEEDSAPPLQTEGALLVEGGEPPPEKPMLSLGYFRYNNEYNEIESCPNGEAPLSNGVGKREYRAEFAGKGCASCPLSKQCPSYTKQGSANRHIRWRDVKAATSTRQREQQESRFKDNYRIRSGIESMNEELKSRHGAGRLRVRGQARVEMTMQLKGQALNIKRSCQAAMRPPTERIPASSRV